MSFWPERCLLAYCSTYNPFFMDLLLSSFVSHSSLLTVKNVNLGIAHDGLPSQWKSSIFIIVAVCLQMSFLNSSRSELLFNEVNIADNEA